MNVRLRRLYSDYNKIIEDFKGHPYVIVEPIYGNPPERYRIIYKLKGLKYDHITNRPKITNLHEVEIYLHKDYPREKPKCEIKTPIFHPNFNEWICIGDNWAPGESLSSIIIQIGDMIQYKNYNYKNGINEMAARWASLNVHHFPIGRVDLFPGDTEVTLMNKEKEDVSITLVSEEEDEKKKIDIKFI